MGVIGMLVTSARDEDARRKLMRTPDEVAAMLELKRRCWGAKRIAREFGACPKTVRRYLREGGWTGYSRARRPLALVGLESWLEERLVRHAGNADLVRQELASERGIGVSLRTVERACAPFRQRPHPADASAANGTFRRVSSGRTDRPASGAGPNVLPVLTFCRRC